MTSSFRERQGSLVGHESYGPFQSRHRPGELGRGRHRRILDLADDLEFLQTRARSERVIDNLAHDNTRRRILERRRGGAALNVLR